MVARVLVCASVAVSTIASVLLMGASVVGVSPALTLGTPLHLGFLDHFLMHRMTIQVRHRLSAGSRRHTLWISGSVTKVSASIPSVAMVSSIAMICTPVLLRFPLLFTTVSSVVTVAVPRGPLV